MSVESNRREVILSSDKFPERESKLIAYPIGGGHIHIHQSAAEEYGGDHGFVVSASPEAIRLFADELLELADEIDDLINVGEERSVGEAGGVYDHDPVTETTVYAEPSDPVGIRILRGLAEGSVHESVRLEAAKTLALYE